MIKSFRSRALKRLVEKGDYSGVNPNHHRRVRLILVALEAAASIGDMNRPGFDFHPLKGRNAKRCAVSVSGNWRITFRFEGGDAHEVDYLDYH